MLTGVPELHANHPPRIDALLDILAEHRVRYVLIGSVAARAYAMDVEPGDLDIAPDMEPPNLERLAHVLHDVEAQPDPDLAPGRWTMGPDGEYRWVEEPITQEVVAARAAWRPEPEDGASFDALFRTRLGNFDVVPFVAGTYGRLRRRAVEREIGGRRVRVAHVDDLLATLTTARRKKDTERVRELRAWQARHA